MGFEELMHAQDLIRDSPHMQHHLVTTNFSVGLPEIVPCADKQTGVG